MRVVEGVDHGPGQTPHEQGTCSNDNEKPYHVNNIWALLEKSDLPESHVLRVLPIPTDFRTNHSFVHNFLHLDDKDQGDAIQKQQHVIILPSQETQANIHQDAANDYARNTHQEQNDPVPHGDAINFNLYKRVSRHLCKLCSGFFILLFGGWKFNNPSNHFADPAELGDDQEDPEATNHAFVDLEDGRLGAFVADTRDVINLQQRLQLTTSRIFVHEVVVLR